MMGSPFSRSRAAVSFSLRVADSRMDRASWLRLITIISFLANIRLKTSHFVVLVITSLRDAVACAEPSQPGALDLDQKVYLEILLLD
jgi:hypothetical protein